MAQHHFILMYDDETQQWEHDVDSEETRFIYGTVYHPNKEEWGYSYLGDGEFHPLEEGLIDNLTEAINNLNAKKIRVRV